MNKIQLLGHVGKDAELRYTPEGKPIMTFSLATDDGFGDKKRTIWFNCAMFGDRCVKLAEFVVKGALVFVDGRLNADKTTNAPHTWIESKDDQTTIARASYDVAVGDLVLLGGKRDDVPAEF